MIKKGDQGFVVHFFQSYNHPRWQIKHAKVLLVTDKNLLFTGQQDNLVHPSRFFRSMKEAETAAYDLLNESWGWTVDEAMNGDTVYAIKYREGTWVFEGERIVKGSYDPRGGIGAFVILSYNFRGNYLGGASSNCFLTEKAAKDECARRNL